MRCVLQVSDSKAMRQHMAGHDLQSADDWFGRYKVLMSSHVCCVLFETRMVSIQERTQAPLMSVLCGLRPNTRNQHTIVSWSKRRNPTGRGYQRTNIDGSLQTGNIRNL